MAVPKSPWSVKGIEPEAREAAKIAARRAGLTIGQWLNLTIRSVAAEQLSGSRPPPGILASGFDGGRRTPPGDHACAEGAANSNFRPPAPTMEAVSDSLQKLSTRVTEAEKSTTEMVAPLAGKVEPLSTRVEEVSTPASVTTAPVERAVTRLAERLEKLEQGSHKASAGWWRRSHA